MQEQQNTFYTDMELEKIKHTDVAHLWLQDEVKSNRLRIRRVKSQANLVDIGTKAISNTITRKHAISMVYVDAQENLKTGGVMGLWIDESERADQSSSFSAVENVIGVSWSPCPTAAATAAARAAKSR